MHDMNGKVLQRQLVRTRDFATYRQLPSAKVMPAIPTEANVPIDCFITTTVFSN
jgi:hypothetical protein